MGASFEQQVTVPVAREHVWQQAHAVLNSMPSTSVTESQPEIIRASVGTGILSWGENVTLHMSDTQQGTAVRIRSQCSFPLQLIDWGKNRKNVQEIVRGITPHGTTG